MRLVIFGLTVTSSWGNGHATIWRGLLASLAKLGHDITFFERDVPYYANQRDLHASPHFEIVLYPDWNDVLARARSTIEAADAAIVTSYCPDAVAAAALVTGSDAPLRVFYDLDTPVTLDRLSRGETVDYIPPEGLRAFDLVLSYTGGRALHELETRLGARIARPLYGSVDPAAHARVVAIEEYRAGLSYLGTYAQDRQPALQQLFLAPAAALPDRRFVIGGAQYPQDFPWLPNVWFVRHLPPPLHPAFYSSSLLTLNITRAAMADMGFCPSGRLFEAAACCTPIVSDWWEGLDAFFTPGREVVIARTSDDVIEAMSMSEVALRHIGEAARERAVAEHTAMHRAQELVDLLRTATRAPGSIEPAPAAGGQ